MRNIFLLLALLLALTVGRWRASAQPGAAPATPARPAPAAPVVNQSLSPAAGPTLGTASGPSTPAGQPGRAAGSAADPAAQSRLPPAGPSGLVPAVGPVPGQPNVVLVLLDGVRQQEWTGKALDDFGNPVRTSEVLPNLMRLRKSGLFFPHFQISNPAGVSLPAYADIFAGRRQERILTNSPPAADLRSHYPTLFQTVKKNLGLGFDGVALITSWSPLCAIAQAPPLMPQDDFYRSCGVHGTNAGPVVSFKPELYEGSRADTDTFLEILQEVPKRTPRLLVVHLGDADEEAHMHSRVQHRAGVDYGIFHYHNALRQDDYLVGRIWAFLQSHPFYRNNTYLLVTTDHGRDSIPEPDQWANHGRCVAEHTRTRPCSGCSGIFALALGPGLPARTVKAAYKHTDLAPTIAKILGVTMPEGSGRLMREITDTLPEPHLHARR